MTRSTLAPGTEGGKVLLNDFKEWRTTGYRPNARRVGGKEHWMSKKLYQECSLLQFKIQAKKIATIAIQEMSANDVIDLDEARSDGED